MYRLPQLRPVLITRLGQTLKSSHTRTSSLFTSVANAKCLPCVRAWAKLRNAIISYIMFIFLPIRPSAWNNSTPSGQIFINFDV
jgi:hypothetical protein